MRIFFPCTLLFFIVLNLNAQDAQKIHESAVLVDTHNDVLSTVSMIGMDFGTDLKGKFNSDLGRFRKGGVDIQIFSIFCDDHYGKGSAYAYANREIDSLYAMVARHPDQMMIVASPSELAQAVKLKKLGAMLGVEGGHMIEDDLGKLDSFYRRGVRYMTLTWNNSTSWASSAWDEKLKSFIVTPYGLTAFGISVVKRMNELGMMIDVSHIGEATLRDAIAATTKPVLASHSSVYALCPVPRNLKDDQIRAIAKNGGVIQVNFYSGFLDSNYNRKLDAFISHHKKEFDSLLALKQPSYMMNDFLSKKYPQEAAGLRPPLSLLIDHIDYIVKLVGVDYVGLGSDFDGSESTPKGLDGVDDFPKITAALLQRGYKEKDIKKILGGNFIRVFKANSH
ncbi:MAG: dipeptidase [Chitinophagales bacterium]